MKWTPITILAAIALVFAILGLFPRFSILWQIALIILAVAVLVSGVGKD